jgi:glycosyltransferase involved in cell wall biosynthesis
VKAELAATLSAEATCLLHPMAGEHFGIVPVEAMARARPVLAVAGAGPDETVVDGVTGALRSQDTAAFAEVLAAWALAPGRMRALGAAGPARARDFSLENFAARWVPWVQDDGRTW